MKFFCGDTGTVVPIKRSDDQRRDGPGAGPVFLFIPL
jgi:hypothetical protein